ncbi:MAG TPA: AsmA family protein [Candidatus Sulfotelmatobacter sp.]|nr:AsmA family protein [Candidatus Sulfotelmatobacter sp.]
MKSSFFKRCVAITAALLLALFVIRPGASRLKSRIIYSISAGVGRPVDVGSVHLRLLPRPAFDLENLVIYDDPTFGAEPMVRASEVTAAVRITSLLRGRLEIARLDLTEPSLNLVHSQTGHWNLEALLERSARIPLAPTGKTKSEPRPGFPYIEATSGRINFKNGPEKKPYALTNADFSLWQESQNTWGIRLKAQPFRTDMNLNDTGLLRVDGIWQRATSIVDTPLNLKLEWSDAQLGQITKLITGNDRGWRGEILLDVALRGTPAKLQIAASSSIDDFRRYDITSGRSLRMRGRCNAQYSSESHEFRQVMCNAPVGDGMITLTGDVAYPGSKRYSLVVAAEKVPAIGLIMLGQRVKKNVPDDLMADGTLYGNISIQDDGELPTWKGHGEIADLHLSSASIKSEIGPETLPFVVTSDLDAREHSRKRPSSAGVSNGIASEFQLAIGPFHLSQTRAGTATLRGSVTRTGYNFAVSGEMEIAKALGLARATGLPAITSSADGSAQLDLQISGNWISSGDGFGIPQVIGSAKLRNVHTSSPGPVDIVTADLQLMPEVIHLSKLNAKAGGSLWTGSVDLPRGCGTPDACLAHVSLNTKRLDLSGINTWLNTGAIKHPWYQVLTSTLESRPAWWTSVHAVGRIAADVFYLHNVQATRVSANLSMEQGKLQLSGFNADLLGGKYKGEWKVEFANKPALCTGTGTLTGISLATIAESMNDGWVAGSADGSYEVKGPCVEFWQKAEGVMHVQVRDGILPHILLAGSTEPLRASELKGKAHLQGGDIEISDTQMISPDGTYGLTGTVSLDRQVNLRLTRVPNQQENAGYTISGTLETPRITALTRTEQARLKTPPSQ